MAQNTPTRALSGVSTISPTSGVMMEDENNKFRHSFHSQQQQQQQQQQPMDEQPGLEAAPSRYSTAPIPYNPPPPSEAQSFGFSASPGPMSPDMQSSVTEPKWVQTQVHNVYTEPPPPPPPLPEKRRVMGLTVPMFWGIVVAIVVILAAAIAGGIAGGLSAQKSNAASSASSSTSTAAVESQATDAATTRAASGSGSPTTMTTIVTTMRPTSRVSGLLPAPTDGGCPTVDQTTFTPINAEGTSIAVGSGSAQTFRQLCEVNYPGGAAYGNPGIYDILKSYVTTFEECMTLCAEHNQAYAKNVKSGAVSGTTGYCRSVAMIKLPGEYCYLKNATGKSDTMGHPKDFISAVIVSGLSSE